MQDLSTNSAVLETFRCSSALRLVEHVIDYHCLLPLLVLWFVEIVVNICFANLRVLSGKVDQ